MTVATVSLYLELEEGQVADMETVARAAIAFSQAIKSLAFQLDPAAEVRVELESGTEGSLSLNTLIRLFGKLKSDHPLAVGIAAGAVAWFTAQGGSYAFSKIADAIVDDDGKAPITQEQAKDIIERLDKLSVGRPPSPQVQGVYRAIEHDPAIKGVGVTTIRGAKPENIVPRSEFRERAGLAPRVTTLTTRHREATETITVVLVSPVLEEGDRRWRFRAPTGEFGAPVKDAEFLQRVLSGTTAIPMRAGIEMKIELQVVEDFENGVWVTKARNVVRVLGLKGPAVQADLLPPPAGSDPNQRAD